MTKTQGYPAWCLSPRDRVNVDLIRLIRSSKASDPTANHDIETFLLFNRGLINKAVSQFAWPRNESDREDLIQDAQLIMLEMLPRYDEERGAVSTFFLLWLRAKLPRTDSNRLRFGISLPRNLAEKRSAVEWVAKEIYLRTGNYPNRIELAQSLFQRGFDGTPASIAKLLEDLQLVHIHPVSILPENNSENGRSDHWELEINTNHLGENWSDPVYSGDQVANHQRYLELLQQLNDYRPDMRNSRTMSLLIARFRSNPPRSLLIKSNVELAKELGITREAIRQNLANLVKRLQPTLDIAELSRLARLEYYRLNDQLGVPVLDSHRRPDQ